MAIKWWKVVGELLVLIAAYLFLSNYDIIAKVPLIYNSYSFFDSPTNVLILSIFLALIGTEAYYEFVHIKNQKRRTRK